MDDDRCEKTVIGKVSVEAGWHIYRLRTKNSQYSLGLRLEGKRVAALRRLSSGAQDINVRDTAPMIGGIVAFDVPPEQWAGKVLEVAGVSTSPIVSITRESDVNVITELTSPGAIAMTRVQPTPAPRQKVSRQPKYDESAYPLNFLEYIESAHILLSTVAREKKAVEAIAQDRRALERLQIALAGCRMMADTLAERLSRLADGTR